MPEPKPARARRRLSPRARQVGAWLLAPLLASAAIAFQIALDVPRAPMLQKQAKKPKPQRKSAAARNAERIAKAKTAAKAKASGKAQRVRSEAALAGLRTRWSEQPLEDEPINQNFRRRHEGLVRSAVTRARARALDGATPPSMQIRPKCHTVRCELELCGPSPVISAIAELLPGVTLDGHQLWHELREVEPAHDPADRKPTKDHVCRRWIVDFKRDGGDIKKLAVPELKPPGKHEATAG